MAPDGAPIHYERHRPEQTTLYRLVRGFYRIVAFPARLSNATEVDGSGERSEGLEKLVAEALDVFNQHDVEDRRPVGDVEEDS